MADKDDNSKIECEPITMDEFKSGMKELLSRKVETRSENRTPTKEELNEKFRLERRG